MILSYRDIFFQHRDFCEDECYKKSDLADFDGGSGRSRAQMVLLESGVQDLFELVNIPLTHKVKMLNKR